MPINYWFLFLVLAYFRERITYVYLMVLSKSGEDSGGIALISSLYLKNRILYVQPCVTQQTQRPSNLRVPIVNPISDGPQIVCPNTKKHAYTETVPHHTFLTIHFWWSPPLKSHWMTVVRLTLAAPQQSSTLPQKVYMMNSFVPGLNYCSLNNCPSRFLLSSSNIKAPLSEELLTMVSDLPDCLETSSTAFPLGLSMKSWLGPPQKSQMISIPFLSASWHTSKARPPFFDLIEQNWSFPSDILLVDIIMHWYTLYRAVH